MIRALRGQGVDLFFRVPHTNTEGSFRSCADVHRFCWPVSEQEQWRPISGDLAHGHWQQRLPLGGWEFQREFQEV